MDPVTNPFVPGAGTPPPELVGRKDLLEKSRIALSRILRGNPAKSLVIVGLRGVGKTVLLVSIEDLAKTLGFKTIMIEAPEGKSLAQLLISHLRQVLFSLDAMAHIGHKAKRALNVLRSFANALKLSIGDVDLGISISAEKGIADSGDLEADLSALLVCVGEAAKEAQTGLLICIDELQYLSPPDFSALIMSIHRINQLGLPLILIGAGLPQILGLAGNAKSYAERLFDYPSVGALPLNEAIEAIQGPARQEGVAFTQEALQEIFNQTQGYPYFLQQWGYEAWNLAQSSPIGIETIHQATLAAIQSLDESFFKVRFDRCTPSEKRYLKALADLGSGAHRSGDVADQMNDKVSTVAPTRSKLIKKGMIYSPQHGDTEFTVPMFDQYLKRIMEAPPPAKQ